MTILEKQSLDIVEDKIWTSYDICRYVAMVAWLVSVRKNRLLKFNS